MRSWKLLLATALFVPGAAQAQSYRSIGVMGDIGVLVQVPTSGLGSLRQATVLVVYEPAAGRVVAHTSLLNLDCDADHYNELEQEWLDASLAKIGQGPRRTGSAYKGYAGLVAAHLCDGKIDARFNQVYQGKLAAVTAMRSKIRGY